MEFYFLEKEGHHLLSWPFLSALISLSLSRISLKLWQIKPTLSFSVSLFLSFSENMTYSLAQKINIKRSMVAGSPVPLALYQEVGASNMTQKLLNGVLNHKKIYRYMYMYLFHFPEI